VIDFGMIAMILAASLTSINNDLGPYDGLFFAASTFIGWGTAYILGRAFFGDRDGLRALVVAVFVGGLVYIPFCLWEIRMSPHLHEWVYGFQQHSWPVRHRRAQSIVLTMSTPLPTPLSMAIVVQS
jgi:hypothetical protein